MPSRKHIRHKLLLDEGLHLPKCYPNLNRSHNLLHVSQVNLRGKKDEDISGFAISEKRLLVVFNIKDFKKFIKQHKPSIISLSVNLTDKQADLKLCKVLKKLKRGEAEGHLISVTTSGITVKRIINN